MRQMQCTRSIEKQIQKITGARRNTTERMQPVAARAAGRSRQSPSSVVVNLRRSLKNRTYLYGSLTFG